MSEDYTGFAYYALPPSELTALRFPTETELDLFLDALDRDFPRAIYELPDKNTVIIAKALSDWSRKQINEALRVEFIEVNSPDDLSPEDRELFEASRGERLFGKEVPRTARRVHI